jgi:hypothetical protein
MRQYNIVVCTWRSVWRGISDCSPTYLFTQKILNLYIRFSSLLKYIQMLIKKRLRNLVCVLMVLSVEVSGLEFNVKT